MKIWLLKGSGPAVERNWLYVAIMAIEFRLETIETKGFSEESWVLSAWKLVNKTNYIPKKFGFEKANPKRHIGPTILHCRRFKRLCLANASVKN